MGEWEVGRIGEGRSGDGWGCMKKKEHGMFIACRFITEEEVASVMDVLMPGERHYAKEQAEHMMTQVSHRDDESRRARQGETAYSY